MKLDRTTMMRAPMLSEAEERAALTAFAETRCPAALTRLVMSHARLAYAMARRKARGDAEFWDLLASGLLGLVTAAHAFRLDRGDRFATFAAYHVRNQIDAEAASLQFPVTVSKHQRRAAAADALAQAGVSLPETVALDAEVGEGGERLSDIMPSTDPTPEQCHEETARTQALRSLVAGSITGLDRISREIVERHALAAQEPLECIASDLGITTERARTLQRRAFLSMRRSLLANGFSPSVLS